MNTAYFIKHPRSMGDLRLPHLLSQERPYEVVKEIVLAGIDYVNFITDMAVDRQFIKDNAKLCAEREIMKCLLIRRRRGQGGVLVVPERGAFVKWAAYAE